MRRFFHNIYELLEMIKIGHSVLALPFAFMGALLAARGLPAGRTLFWILVAMVGARSAAMAFNRLVDARLDGANPRTADRALPAGKISRSATLLFIGVSAVVFMGAAAQLNRLCFLLSPAALAVILGYSLTKRFTAASHLVLGLSLGLAPVGGWLAVRSDLSPAVLVLAGAVLFWVAGFDILYALQDEEFDRQAGLFSVPARVGPSWARRLAAGCHLLAALGFAVTGRLAGLGLIYTGAVAVSAVILLVQHLLLSVREPLRLPPAFFTLNGLVGIGLGLATWLSLAI
ncbi:MAG: putative 4-hydroxybenzoate polyprenyltransferase [Syntrophobacterales bacterium]|jgi:4-hydroxybenzoate polyprenyltransferase|nr:putative 4-hydroxybenzoate polyprenyltransferase [Syntrophobacterales bacterium]